MRSTLTAFDKIKSPVYLRTTQWSINDAQQQLTDLEVIKNNTFFNGPKKRNIQNLINIINHECVNEKTDLTNFFQTNNILDHSRNTSLLDVHPYMEKYYV